MRGRRLLLVLTAASLALAVGTRLRGPAGTSSRRAAPVREGAPAVAARGGRDLVTARTRGPAAGVAAGKAPAAPVAATPDPRTRPVVGRQIVFPHGTPARSGDLPAVARRVLEENRAAMGLDRIPGELRMVREFTSLSGHHLRFRQFVGGVPVEGSEVAVHVARDGRPLLLQADVFPVGDVATTPAISAEAAVAAAREYVVGTADDEDDDPAEAAALAASFLHAEPSLFVRPEGRTGRLVWRVDVVTDDESARISVDARDGDVVDSRDLRIAADGQARVYRPNPVATTHDTTLADRKDADSPALTAARDLVILPRLDGTGRIRGTWCDAARGAGDVSSATLDWTMLTRSSKGFEAVNAYYHIDRAQDLFQSLGLTAANAEQQKVDVHALTSDQSYFDTFSDTIKYGDGGVDDAEDGDIVVHEYGHAVQNDQVTDFGGTAEGSAMGEGFSDFLACWMHSDRSGADTVWDPLVGAWDATAYSADNPPFLRRVDLNKRYPRDVVDEPHDDGSIWSRLLWDLRTLLGADDALRVVVESHTFLDSNARFLHGANAILVANESLRQGADDPAIRTLLRARGLPFNFPPLTAPPEDPYEENDDAAHAAPLALGTHEDLLLADDDWFRATVAPFRRFRVQADFDPVDVDLDLELRTADGAGVDASQSVSGAEVVSGVSGHSGASFLVAARRGGSTVGISSYRLTLQELPLETLRGGRTTPRRTVAGASDAVTFAVSPTKVGTKSKLVLTSVAQRKGSVNDLRIVTPSGATAADFGFGRTRLGTRVVLDLSEAGTWRIEARARDGTSGRYTIQAKIKR